jgi:ArsR family transcriptional regulator
MMVLGITQSKASRHLRYLYHLGLVTDRREGLWMYYRLAAPEGSQRENQLQALAETLAASSEARALKGKLQEWFLTKGRTLSKCECEVMPA